MYGRNELIARYIKVRTGKTRTRKQVSSHIQVLARRKAREIQTKLKDQPSKEVALQSMSSMSSAQIVSLFCSSQDQASKEKVFQSLASSLSPSPLVTTKNSTLVPPPSPFTNSPTPEKIFNVENATSLRFWPSGLAQPGPSEDLRGRSFFSSIKPFSGQASSYAAAAMLGKTELLSPPPPVATILSPPYEARTIASSKLRLIEFSAFMEDHNGSTQHKFVHINGTSAYSEPLESVDIKQIYDKFPEKKGGLKDLYDKGPQNAFFLVKFWADLNSGFQNEAGAFYAVSSQFESNDNMVISCSTKVCSFGKQVVEKVETEQARFENGHFVYKINRSPMCEYMVNFINKLKHLPEKYMMNSVLENFTILQVVTNRDTQETLLCIALVFEVSSDENGAQHHIYRLVKE